MKFRNSFFLFVLLVFLSACGNITEETEEGLLTHFEDTIFLHQISLATRENKLLAEYPGETVKQAVAIEGRMCIYISENER